VPEQEQQRSVQPPEHEEISEAREQIGEALAQSSGAATISPLIMLPPVLIAAVMGLLLAMVYAVTEEPIAEAKRKDKQDKLTQVMPAFGNDILATEQELSEDVRLYVGEHEGAASGFGMTSAVKTGYSGYFSIVFGIAPDGTIERVRVLESAETPGLGSKAAESPYIDQFDGKPLDYSFMVAKDGGEIDAVTGATITSRAVCSALSQGIGAFESAGGIKEFASRPTDTAEQPGATEAAPTMAAEEELAVAEETMEPDAAEAPAAEEVGSGN